LSLVGPRPDVVPVEQYQEKQRKRFEVLPGLTGLWQISGKNHTTFNEMNQLDVRYVERRSLLLDLKIVTLTLPAILKEVSEDFVAKRFYNGKQAPLPIERQHDSTT
jgi:lipopolysaccharide/colanic/teichoic acid biosynthesis glycosyltransferase